MSSKFQHLALRLSVCVAVFLCFGVWRALGQMTSQGTVTVTVFDQQGNIVQGAKLELTDTVSNELHTGDSLQSGSFSFVGLPSGKYRLSVSKTGFKNSVVDDVVVQVSRTTDLKVTLEVGQVVETVTVDVEAAPLVETTASSIGSTIDMKQIEGLPIQGRDISGLAFLIPGFTGTPGNGTWGGLPVIAQGNNIDGVLASTSRMKFGGNSQPGLEARLEGIEEMTIQTGQTDLSQGLGTASMQVNFVTRRGGNDYHGRVYEDFRNTVLNANSWINNATGAPRDPIILNDFGGSVGGKIIKDKLFFFGSFAMSKQPGGYEAGPVYLLSPQAQQGIFTYTTGPMAGQTVNLFNVAANTPGLPTQVNGSNSGSLPQVAPELALINKNITAGTVTPVPNDANLETVRWRESSPITRYYPAVRVDYNVSQKVKLDFSFQETKINQPNASPPILPGPDFASQAGLNKSNNYITSVGVSWTITPNLINQFRGGYYYNAFWYGLGSKPLWAPPTALPQVSWASPCAAINCNFQSGQSFDLPVSTYYPIVNFSDNASWLHGAHTVSFGVSFYREQDHYWNPPDGINNISLGLVNGDSARNAFDSYFNGAGATSTDRGEAEAIYANLAGRVSGVAPVGSGFPYDPKTGKYATQPGQAYNLDELQKGWGLYTQDSFRVTPHLTVNYGLRWDFTGDDHDLTAAYHGANAEAMFGPSGVGNVFKPGTLTGNMDPAYVARSHQYAPWNVSPQPTLGVAWNPTHSQGFLSKLLGGSNTVVRAGFDIKRFTEPYQYFWNNASNHGLAFFQYFSYLPSQNFSPGALSLGDTIDSTQFTYSPTAYAASIPESTYTWNYYWGAAGIDPHIKQPYVQEWNLGIQRQLGQSNVLEVRYVGHRSVHQWIQINPNEVNIFENGFLKEFQAAQTNLAACMANATCSQTPSFANQGLPGQMALPIFNAAFACPPGASGCTPGADYTNSSFILDLNQGAAGALASQLAYPAGTVPYICNLVGSSLSPCATQFGYTSPGAYPLNFFQANPLGASFSGVAQSYQVAGGYGNYHALQMDFRQRPWHGMQFDVNYTWSHTLGLQPENYQGAAAAWLAAVNTFTLRNLRLNYGPTNFDLRHVIHASGTFELPFGKGKSILNKPGAVDKIVGGWSVGTIVTWETGFPFQLFGGYNTFNDTADGGLVLSGLSVSQLQKAVGVYTPTASQCDPTQPCTFKDIINPALRGSGTGNCNSVITGICQNTTPGTLGYNPWLHGPRLWNVDMSLSKSINLTERFKFTFQAEALNAFNHVNWGNSSSLSVGSSDFGTSGPFDFLNANGNQAGALVNNAGARVLELRANITF
jgi:hypothetical protein